MATTLTETGITFPDSTTQSSAAVTFTMPVGLIVYYPKDAVPTGGWLQCNGAAISRTAYANLYSLIGTTYGAGNGSTTFNIPDLRGEFIRGFDGGRGIDTGRTIGSFQEATGISYDGRSQQHVQNYENSYSSSSDTNGPASYQYGEARTFVRIRPRNIALVACIKY